MPTRRALACQLLTILLGSLLTACAAVNRQRSPAPPFYHAPPPYPVPVGGHFHDRAFSPEMVVIPAGVFTMGSTEAETMREGRRTETAAFERPQHRVRLAQPLAVSRFPVTRREYAAFVSATKRAPPAGCNVLDGKWQFEAQRSFLDPGFAQTDLDPAICVDVDDAQAYAAWLSAATGREYRLLHEAEWEYAARAGTTSTRWWADDRAELCAHTNGADRSYDRVHPGDGLVNLACDDGYAHSNPGNAFPANAFGLYDMIGNVWEWTADCFVSNYNNAAADTADNTPGDASAQITGGDCSRRAIRGASWHNYPDALRSAARFWLPPDMRSSSLGFRLARVADATSGPAIAFMPVDSLPRFAAPHFNFVTLLVADPERALKFYTQALGMKERGRAQPNAQFAEIVVAYDMAPLAAGLSLTFRNGPPTLRGNGSSSVNLVVVDLAGILKKVPVEGGNILKPLMRSDLANVSYSIALIQDPDGNTLELVEYHRIGRQ